MTYDNVALYLTNPTFIVLALMSVYSVTVMINQAYYLFSSREKGPELVQFLENARNGYTEIMAFLKAKDTPHRRLVQAWLKHRQQSAARHTQRRRGRPRSVNLHRRVERGWKGMRSPLFTFRNYDLIIVGRLNVAGNRG